LISFSPYHIGHSRLLTHEGLISVLLLLSILAYVSYLFQGGRKIDLVVSAGAGGIACLTKSTSTIIIPFIGLIVVIAIIEHVFNSRRKGTLKWSFVFKTYIAPGLIWLVVFSVIYIALWPAMWVEPLETLSRLYGAAIGMGFGDSGLIGTADVDSFNTILRENIIGNYFEALLWRSTPIIWVGVFLVILLFLKSDPERNLLKRIAVYLFLFGFLYLLMMSIAGDKFSGHYVMTALVCLNFIAGLGYGVFGSLILEIRRYGVHRFGGMLLMGLVVSLQALNAFSYYPYYFNYANPIMIRVNNGVRKGLDSYGVGLDLAAEYLSQKTDAENLTVMSWWSGTVAYLFPGEVQHLAPRSRWSDAEIDRLKSSDYLVVYYDVQKRRNQPPKLMADLVDVSPEYAIFLYDIEYVRIYKVRDLPERVFIPDGINE
jgi:4-amino-4-deoxy-L-arabinose transferase-like glycosyltransferase